MQELLKNETLENFEILKELAFAHRYLGELKGKAESLPNPWILVATLPFREAEDSSKIENIVTTQHKIFESQVQQNKPDSDIEKVFNYNRALFLLFDQYHKKQFISGNMILEAQKMILKNNSGFRTQLGTTLVDEKTKKVIYEPPPPQEARELFNDLIEFINQNKNNLDPILKMGIIHHQFESIHPFYDGNGRVGRIINIIYLIKENLLDLPILYLSQYLNQEKINYYSLLQKTRETQNWTPWLVFMTKAVAQTAQATIKSVDRIKNLQQKYKSQIKSEHPKIYSQDLINHIFQYPYTKSTMLAEQLEISRSSGARYLEKLTQSSLLEKKQFGRENIYINFPLFNILSEDEG